MLKLNCFWTLVCLLLVGLRPAFAQVIANDVTTLEPGQKRLTYIYIGTNGTLQFDRSGKAQVGFSNQQDINMLRLTLGIVPDLDIHIQTGEGFVSQENGSRSNSPTWGAGADDSQIRVRWRILNDETVKIGLLSSTTIPTGSVTDQDMLGIGQGFTSQTEDLIIRFDSERWTIWNEAFYAFPLDRANIASSTFGANFTVGYTIGDSVQPTIELNYLSTQPGDIQSLATTLGMTFLSGDFIIQVAVQKVLAGVNTADVTRPILFFHYNF